MPGAQAPPRISLSEIKSLVNPPRQEVNYVSTPTVSLGPYVKPANPELNRLRNRAMLAQQLAQTNSQGRPLFYEHESGIIPIQYLTSIAEIDRLQLPAYAINFLKDGRKVIADKVYIPQDIILNFLKAHSYQKPMDSLQLLPLLHHQPLKVVVQEQL